MDEKACQIHDGLGVMKRLKIYLPLLLLIGLSLSAWYLGIYHYFSFDILSQQQKAIELFTIKHYVPSVLIYGFTYILVVSLSIPAATFMTITGGFLFGQFIGTCTAIISATIGATLLFMAAKMASQAILSQKAESWIHKMQAGFQENAGVYLLTLRLIPIFPFIAVNLVAALLQVPLRTFFFGTLFGIAPGSFVYVSIGVALHKVIQQPDFNTMLDPKIIIALAGLGILSILPVLYKHLKHC